MFKVSSNFIGSFKLGDNIVRNLETLRVLYECMENLDEDEKPLLYKPAVVWIAAVVESVLHDLHCRAKTFTQEGVLGVPGAVLAYIRGKQLDEFNGYIASAKKHNLLKLTEEDNGLYTDIDELRKLRNRVHIQNAKGHRPLDESEAFTLERLQEAEAIAEFVVKRVAKNNKRGRNFDFVKSFEFPWQEHFPEE